MRAFMGHCGVAGDGVSRVMGVDVGEVRIGVAVSDASNKVAIPFRVLERRGDKEDAAALVRLARELGAGEVVIGFPLGLARQEGASAQRAQALAERLEEVAGPGLKVWLWDERFTTCIAEKALIEGNVSRRKRRHLRDKLAAALILQGFLDRRLSVSEVREKPEQHRHDV